MSLQSEQDQRALIKAIDGVQVQAGQEAPKDEQSTVFKLRARPLDNDSGGHAKASESLLSPLPSKQDSTGSSAPLLSTPPSSESTVSVAVEKAFVPDGTRLASDSAATSSGADLVTSKPSDPGALRIAGSGTSTVQLESQASLYRVALPEPPLRKTIAVLDSESRSLTGHTTSSGPVSQEQADIRAWQTLLSAPVPDTAYDRLATFLTLHFGQCRNPGVYKPFCQFDIRPAAGSSSRQEAVLTLLQMPYAEYRDSLLPGGTYAEHMEEMAIRKLREKFLSTCLRKKQPKAVLRPLIDQIISKYSNLKTLGPSSKAMAFVQPTAGQLLALSTPSGSEGRQKPPVKIAGSAPARPSASVTAAYPAGGRPTSTSAASPALTTSFSAPAVQAIQASSHTESSSKALPPMMPKAMREVPSASVSGSPRESETPSLTASTGPAASRQLSAPSTSTSSIPTAPKAAAGLPKKPAFDPRVPLSPPAADYSMPLRDHYQPLRDHYQPSFTRAGDRVVTSISASMERKPSGESSESEKRRRGKRRERSPSSAPEDRQGKRRQSDSRLDHDYPATHRRSREPSERVRRSRSPRRSRLDERQRDRSRSRSPERRERHRDRRRDEEGHRFSRRTSDDSDFKHDRLRRRSHDESSRSKRRRSSDSGTSDEAVLTLLDLVTKTASGKLEIAQAVKAASDLGAPATVKDSALAALQAIHEASPSFIMQQSNIPAG